MPKPPVFWYFCLDLSGFFLLNCSPRLFSPQGFTPIGRKFRGSGNFSSPTQELWSHIIGQSLTPLNFEYTKPALTENKVSHLSKSEIFRSTALVSDAQAEQNSQEFRKNNLNRRIWAQTVFWEVIGLGFPILWPRFTLL